MAGRSISLAALLCAACATLSAPNRGGTVATQPSADAAASDPFPSTYLPLPSRPTLIRNATILTAAGPRIENGSILLRDGRVVAVAPTIEAPPDATVIDARGRWLTPGIIDTHSHMGVYSAPGIASLSDGNEMSNPVTAQVWAEHSVWPQDPQFALALAGGITAMQVLPGSGNLIGGRGVTLKNVAARTVQGMKFPGAPHGLKMACGENPKRVYGGRTTAPSTSMGNVAGYRAAWIRAAKYRDDWDRWQAAGADPARRPDRDLQLETLAGVLRGEILVHNHCYRADEMAQMIDIAKEFGYRITSFHHAVESYKLRDVLAREQICSSMWADWWGFKLEAFDGIKQNIALVEEAGACAIVHSDDAQQIQRLNQEAAKAMAAGRQYGIAVDREHAIRWLTLNPAQALGIDRWTGSLEPGKNADVVVWSGDPFSVYSKPDLVFIDGALLYDRSDPAKQPRGDFIIGTLPQEVVR
jgi:imidazolonepropionase-like amidohydrolase